MMGIYGWCTDQNYADKAINFYNATGLSEGTWKIKSVSIDGRGYP